MIDFTETRFNPLTSGLRLGDVLSAAQSAAVDAAVLRGMGYRLELIDGPEVEERRACVVRCYGKSAPKPPRNLAITYLWDEQVALA